MVENTANTNTIYFGSAGSFNFVTQLSEGDAYQVRIITQPTSPTHYCGISSGGSNGNGGGTMGPGMVTVNVSCSTTLKRVFVTSNNFDGGIEGSPGKAGADAACMADGNYPGSGTFKALLVTDTGISAGLRRVACTTANCSGGVGEHTDWVFAANTAYERASDATFVFMTNAAGIFPFIGSCGSGGCLQNTFDANTERFWTGLNADWTGNSEKCSNWTTDSSGVNGRYANSSKVDSKAIDDASSDCDTDRRLLCVEQ